MSADENTQQNPAVEQTGHIPAGTLDATDAEVLAQQPPPQEGQVLGTPGIDTESPGEDIVNRLDHQGYVGKIVHYNHGVNQSCAAIITALNADGSVELTIFEPGQIPAPRSAVKPTEPGNLIERWFHRL